MDPGSGYAESGFFVSLTGHVHVSKLAASSRSDSVEESTTRKEYAMKIPHRQLSEAALRGVVESFVLREGTDYGQCEYSLEEKIAAVMRQLDRGEAVIMFEPDTETVSIVVASPPSRRARFEGPEREEP